MPPRRLDESSQCAGGTCPAVWDDLDRGPGYLGIQGDQADEALMAQTAETRADSENLVIIPRQIVEDALRPKPQPLTIAELEAEFTSFGYTAFRLETLQQYAGTARDEKWISLVRANRAWGKVHERVHVVTEPLTPAMTEELTAGYEGNVAAGERIGIIPVTDPESLPGIPSTDFWLFDSTRLVTMHYDPDGTWTGADLITDPQQIAEACRVRDIAWHHADDWASYVRSRPHLTRCLA